MNLKDYNFMPTLTHSALSATKANKKENNASQTRAASQLSTLSDNRPGTLAQMKVVEAMSEGPRAQKTAQLQVLMPSNTPVQKAAEEEEVQMKAAPIQKAPEEEELMQGKFNTVQKAADEEEVQMKAAPIQKKENNTGLPDNLKSGVENLSGVSLDDVKVHTNSDQPAQMQAHAFAQGTDIHVAPGQEQHLPHEAWHVVQQKQGRVKPTAQMKEKIPVNDDKGLEHEADVMGAKALTLGNDVNQKEITKKSLNTSQNVGIVQGLWGSSWFGGDGKETAEEKPEKEQLITSDGLAVDPAQVEKLTPEQQEAVQNSSGGVRRGLEKIAQGSVTNALTTSLDAAAVAALKDPKPSYLENLKTVSQNSGEAAAKGGFEILGSFFGIGLAIKGIYDAYNSATAKWSQWTAFIDGAEQGIDEAIYGLTKVCKGFWTQVSLVFENIIRLTEAIMLLTPAAPIAAAITVGHKIKDGVSWVLGAGKSFYQYMKGEKKVDNSNSLLTKAKNGDYPALKLILNLKLSSVTALMKEHDHGDDGSDVEDKLLEALNYGEKDKVVAIQKEIEVSMTGTGV